MKKTLISALCLTTVSAFAQSAQTIPGVPGSVTSSSTSLSDTRKALKDAGLNLVVDTIATMNRDSKDNDWRGVGLTFDIPLSYKLTAKDSFRLLSEFTVSKTYETGGRTSKAASKQMELVEGRYKRDKILVQADHGIDGSAEIRGLVLTNANTRQKAYTHGFGSVRLNAGRTWGKFSLNATLRQDVSDRRLPSDDVETAPRYQTRYYLSAAYSLTDTVAVGLDTFYNRTIRANNRGTQSYYAAPSVSYTINPDFTVVGFAEFTPFAINDNRILASRITKEATYNLELVATVF